MSEAVTSPAQPALPQSQKTEQAAPHIKPFAQQASGGFMGLWRQLSDSKPTLPIHIDMIRQDWRGQIWYLIQDRNTGLFQHFPESVHYVLGLMDGQRRLVDIWRLARQTLGEEAPTQQDLMLLLSQLYQADLLRGMAGTDVAHIARFRKNVTFKAKISRFMNPLAMRFPLIDPDQLIQKILPFFGWVFSPVGMLLWLSVIGAALVQAGLNWDRLTGSVVERVLSADNLLIMAVVFPLVKAWHELGHAIAVRRWAGEVHEIGIMLLAFMPLPYTDTSFSAAFPSRWQRAAVGAAGMIFELFLAAIAMFIWIEIEAGMLSTICYNIIILATVSTLIFNLNPLIKLDGYYIFSDLMELPALAKRSAEVLKYYYCRYLLGVAHWAKPHWLEGEGKWLILYGVLSPFYRLFVMMAISLFVAGQFFFFGMGLAILALLTMGVWPVVKYLKFVLTAPILEKNRFRALGVSGILVAGLVYLFGFMPIPYWTSAQGVIVAPKELAVRAGGTGFVAQINVENGQIVSEGDVLFQLEEPNLERLKEQTEQQLAELQQKYQALRYRERVEAAITLEQQESIRQRLAHIETRLAGLTVLAERSGTFIAIRDPRDAVGQLVGKGQRMGYIISDGDLYVQAAVTQEKIETVRRNQQGVRLLPHQPEAEPVETVVLRATPRATDRVNAVALTQLGGGDLPLDPGRNDFAALADGVSEAKLVTLDEVFLYDLELPMGYQQSHDAAIGTPIAVRFDHSPEPLAPRLYRSLRQLLLARLNL